MGVLGKKENKTSIFVHLGLIFFFGVSPFVYEQSIAGIFGIFVHRNGFWNFSDQDFF